MMLSPPLIASEDLVPALRQPGHAVLSPASLCDLVNVQAADLTAFGPLWNDLPPDAYLRDGGRYRRRRHSCFVVKGDELVQGATPGRTGSRSNTTRCMAVWSAGSSRWRRRSVARRRGGICSSVWRRRLLLSKAPQAWHVEAHQFRIDTTDGIGRPTPEGAHRDGVDFVAVILVDRVGVKGGETRVFEAAGPAGIPLHPE